MGKPVAKITDIAIQRENANRHTQRGMQALEQSIQADGWIGAITVAADGETFDGSARIEVGATTGFDAVEPIVVRSRGDRPVIHIREDIPSADDPRAKRLGVAANRVAQLNLDFDPAVMAALAEEIDLSGLFRPEEMAGLLEQAGTDMLIPDPEPQKEPTLASECFIEIYCAQNDLDEFRATLMAWGARKSVTVNIQE